MRSIPRSIAIALVRSPPRGEITRRGLCTWFGLSCVALAAASCSRESSAARSSSSITAIRATLPDGSTFELAAPPRRVVPANTAAAEFVALLLGPERLAGLPEQVDDYSSFDFKSRGFENVARFPRYAAEPLILLHPDLVVTHAWQAAETTAVLRSEGTPVLVLKSAASYDDIRATVLSCAHLFDLDAKGASVVADLDRRVASLRERAERDARTNGGARWRALVYSNDGSGGWAAGSATTADTLLRLAGLTNAAAEAGVKGHAGVDFEKLIAIDPDVIVVGMPVHGESGSATKAVLESAPALAELRAIKNHRIAALPGTLLASDSPCLIDGAEALAREIDRLRGATEPNAPKKP